MSRAKDGAALDGEPFGSAHGGQRGVCIQRESCGTVVLIRWSWCRWTMRREWVRSKATGLNNGTGKSKEEEEWGVLAPERLTGHFIWKKNGLIWTWTGSANQNCTDHRPFYTRSITTKKKCSLFSLSLLEFFSVKLVDVLCSVWWSVLLHLPFNFNQEDNWWDTLPQIN